MITREEAIAWMDKQVDAYNAMQVKLGDSIENITYVASGIHIYNIVGLAEAIGHPYTRSYHDSETDKLHFRYKGVTFFGIAWDKRIGKKSA